MSEKEDILKKKMETKGSLRRPRGHIPGPRTVSRIAASILAGCMILMIMTASLPLTWSIPGAGVYAAETAASAAASDPASDAAPGQMTSGGEYDNAADKASGNAASAKTDGPAADRDDTDRNDTGSANTGSDDRKEDQGGADDAAAAKTDQTAADPQDPEEKGGSTGKASGETKNGGESEGSTQETAAVEEGAEAAEGAPQNAGGTQGNAESEEKTPGKDSSGSGSGDSSGTGAGRGQSEEPEKSGGVGRAGSDAAADNKAADNAAAGSTAQVLELEQVWMTAREFDRAYTSATNGVVPAGGYIPSRATIVSKESEIDYEALGIGKDVNGHPGHTTPINVRDENGNTYTGLCVVPDDRGLATWSVLPGVKIVTDAVLLKLYYFTMFDSYGENLAKNRGFGSSSRKVAYAACHEALSMRYAELAGITYDRPNVGDNLRSLINAYRSGVSSKSLPDMTRVHIYISGRTQSNGQWLQAYVFGFIEEEEPAGIVLQKVSSDPDMRYAYDDYYCLYETADKKSVTFGVYTDKACTKKAHVYTDKAMTKEISVIPLGMSGKSGLWNSAEFYCKPGTYYLKELDTPRGYILHKDPFGPYTVGEGKGLKIKAPNTPVYAHAGIIKKDAETAQALEGAEYGLYGDLEDARNEEKPSGVFKTGKDGRSNLLEVLAGKIYYVREISAPAGYKKDTRIYKLNTAQSLTVPVWTEFTDQQEPGKVRVKKSSSDPGADTGDDQGLYSLAGAVYTLYDADGEIAGTLETGKDGMSDYLSVPAGSYTLKETEPSPGFALDIETHDVKVTGGGETTVESTEPVRKAKILVRKVSSEEKEEKEPDTLPVSGAVYSLYNSEEDAKEGRSSAGTFVIGKDGTSNKIEVLAGKTYYVKETKTPEGYLPDRKIHSAKVDSLTEIVTVQSQDQLIFGGVKVCKQDLETKEPAALGGATLQGTIIKIYNDGDFSVYADGKKVLPGAEALTLTTGADGTASTSAHALSYGTYRAQETTAPEGYTKKGAKAVSFQVQKNGEITDLSASGDTSIRDRVIRGDFSLSKINGYTQKRMAGVTFEVTAYDRDGKELEKHRFTTDENGYFESTAAWAAEHMDKNARQGGSAQQAENTNAAQQTENTDQAHQAENTNQAQQTENTDPAQEEENGRLWFGVGTKPDDSLGALPFGSYHIREIEGKNNRGMKMFSDDFSINEDGAMLSLGEIRNILKPVLETELLDENGDHFADQQGMVTLTDNVTYDGMDDYIGKEVTFHGVIYVKETGKPLQIDQKIVECAETRKILSHSGSVQLRFTFDASKAQGRTLVCYEYASEAVSSSGESQTGNPGTEPSESIDGNSFHDSTNGGRDIIRHTDLEDEAQTVHLVLIETDAEDQLTGMHIGQARDGAVTVDHVTCKGLIPGQNYLVTGFLVDKADGKALKDADGAEVTAKASFTAQKSEEIVDLTFTYDASLLEGTTVVAFERLYLKGDGTPGSPQEDSPQNPGSDSPENPDHDKPGRPDEDEPDGDTPIAVHEDPDDEDQSIHYPRIRTNADAARGQIRRQEGSPDGTSPDEAVLADKTGRMTKTVTADGKLVVRDRVTWENLLPGRTYRLQGVLMDKNSGEAFSINGQNVTARAVFTPETRDGQTWLYFGFDAAGLFKDTRSEEAGDKADAKAEKEALQTLRLVAFEELYISSEEKAGEEKSGEASTQDDSEVKPGEDPSSKPDNTGEESKEGDDKQEGGEDGEKKEYLLAEHKDLEDPAQTVALKEPEEPQEPDKPLTPEKPEKPEKPVEPEKPVNPEKPEKVRRKSVKPASPVPVRSGSAVKTGDDTNPAVYLIPALLSALAIAGILLAKYKKKADRK